MVLYALFYERYSKKLRPFVFAFFFVFFFVYQAFLLSNENNLPITPFFIHCSGAFAVLKMADRMECGNLAIWLGNPSHVARYFILIGSPLYWPVIPLRILAFTNPKVWISQQVAHDIWGISWNRGLRNKPIHARISFLSDETHLWDTLTSLKCFFFMLYTHEFKGISCCRPWPAREKQHLVLQLVANEQDSCAILNLSIRVIGWIESFLFLSISYMASLWRRNTTDIHTLQRINNVCYAVAGGRKILPEVSTL